MKPSVTRNSKRKSLSPLSRICDIVSRRAATLALFLLLSTVMSPPLHAQGCTQCRDNTAATPPATQRAYRHAIILMAIAASGIFLGTVVLLKRQP
jgi:hypothetical protein